MPRVAPEARQAEQANAPAQNKRKARSRKKSYRVAAVVAALLLVISFCATTGVFRALDAMAAARDAKQQVTIIETLLQGSDLLQADHLVVLQSHLRYLDADVQRIQGDVPLEAQLADVPGASGIIHLLAMAHDLAHAGDLGINAALILIPNLKGILHGLGDQTTAAQTGAAPTLTLAQIHQAAMDVDSAGALAQAAVRERAQVHDSDLSLIGLSSLTSKLHKLDQATPKLGKYLNDAHTLMAALPTLLGITKPINFLLFDMDSDELRPTGGFLGNYAVLTLSGGKLSSGVHLHDILTLDCPNGNCRPNPLPSRFSWFGLSGCHNNSGDYSCFDVRDSNLDPDFPTSARLAEQFSHQEGVPTVGGVIALTPAIIEQILQISGPLKVEPYGVTVTAANLQDSIHYYHVLSAYCVGNGGDPHCAQVYSGQQYQTSERKVFDAVLGSTLLHTVGTLPATQQNTVIRILFNALGTKDLQVYFNDPQMESVLASSHANGAVQAPQGDSFFVADTNISATYVNGDVQERIADTVTLDAHGAATHDLAITYSYPVTQHPWSSLYLQTGGSWIYHDIVRVFVPHDAQIGDISGCDPVSTSEANHQVLACGFHMSRSDIACYDSCYQGTATLHFRWSVPNAATMKAGASQYSLLLQKQAGTHSTATVTIVPPAHSTLAQPLATPLVAGKTAGQVAYVGKLDKDLTFDLGYHT